MSYSHHHRHHGRVSKGRIMVAVACLFVLGANGWIFAEAAKSSHPLPALKVIAAITLIWMFAGAWLMCTRNTVGRYMVLTVLYAGSMGFFLTGVISASMDGAALAGRLRPIYFATAVYLVASLVLTHSRDVHRLTSRALE